MYDDISFNDVLNKIQSINFKMTDPRMDGYTTWGSKQQLYKIKFLVDEYLEASGTYAGEDEWLADQKTQRALKKIGA